MLNNFNSEVSSIDHMVLVLPSLSGGGAERVFVTLANEFKEKVRRVDLIIVTSCELRYVDEIDSAVNVIYLKKNRTLQGVRPLIRYFRTEKPKVVLCAIGHCVLVTYISLLLSLRRKRTKIFVRVTQSLAADKRTMFGQKFTFLYFAKKLVYRNVNGVVCLTSEMANTIQQKYKLGKRVEIIANPVLTKKLISDSYQCMEKPLPWHDNAYSSLVLSVGRLTYQKDYPTLLHAFSVVRKDHNIKLVILGEGEKRDELETLANELGIIDHIWLPGFVSNPFPYFRKASVFVLSSKWEGLPNVLIQAMACGSPVIASDCPTGPSDILKGGRYGKLVPVGDVGAFANAIQEIVSRNRLNSRASAAPHLDRYNAELIANRYLEYVKG